MGEEEILLNNTFLNSRKRNQEYSQRPNRKKKGGKAIIWKDRLSTEHVYSEGVPIAQVQPPRVSMLEQKRPESTNSRKGDEGKGISGKIVTAKQSIKAEKNSSILT